MSPTWTPTRMRDLTVLAAPGGDHLVIACDSIGGIGTKPHDVYPSDLRTVAHFALRVPLVELIAAGARPVVIVNTLCVEMQPSGAAMIEEFRAMAAELGLDPDSAVTGSTEENVPTTATGVGITVIGRAGPGNLSVGSAQVGDQVFAVGLPMSAPAVRVVRGDPRMPSLSEVEQLTAIPGVHDVLPVGSRGIDDEVSQLARSARLSQESRGPGLLDRRASAGPSTCVLVAGEPSAAPLIGAVRTDLPTELVATIGPPRRPLS